MRMTTFTVAGATHAGVVVEDTIVDLATAWDGHRGSGAATVRDYLARETDHRQVAAAAERLARTGRGHALTDVHLEPPVPDPDKILCIGVNYRDHAAETGAELPTSPLVFAKFRNSLIGPDDPIVLPGFPDRIDYEAELAVVIGRRGKNIAEADALEHVAGVMAFNDVTARDLQRASSQFTLGKAVDTFAPCGPSLVTLDEIGDLSAIRLRTLVNGVVRQDGTTADMIFSVPFLVAYLSRSMTLEPGDIIATGTPAGVGFSRTPPVLLADGDRVVVELERVGSTRNPVVRSA